MSQALQGRCQCGAVTVEVRGGLGAMMQCHCSTCRRLSGGGPLYLAMVDRDAVTIAGETRVFDAVAASGAWTHRHFCPVCGTPTHSELDRFPDKYTLRMGLFEADAPFRPAMAIYTKGAPDWSPIPEGVPVFEAGPGAAPDSGG